MTPTEGGRRKVSQPRFTVVTSSFNQAQFLAETNARTRAGTTPPPEIQARLEVIDAAYADPTFLYLGELRHQVLARRRSE